MVGDLMVYRERTSGITRLTGHGGDTVADALDRAWPVGCIFFSDGPTNPSEMLGVGTWELFSEGRVLVGFSTTDAQFGMDGMTGGAKTVTLTTEQMPEHDHHAGDMNVARKLGVGEGTGMARGNAEETDSASVLGFTGTRGGGEAHENMSPYIVVHIWRRTA